MTGLNEPSQLLTDSTKLQRISGVLAIIFATSAMIMTAYWAHGPNTNEGYLGGLDMGRNTFNWHPVLMVTGSIFCLITSILSYRVLPLPKYIQKTLHGIMHTAAFICMSIGLACILNANNYKEQSSYDAYTANFTNIHTFMGLAVFIMYGLNYVLGIVHYVLPGIDLSLKQSFMSTHVFLGIFILVGSLAAVESGLVVLTGSCGYAVDSPDINPAENYHLLTGGCRLANSIGIVVFLSVFLCFYAVFRSNSARVAPAGDK